MNNYIVTFEYRVMVTVFAILAMFYQYKQTNKLKSGIIGPERSGFSIQALNFAIIAAWDQSSGTQNYVVVPLFGVHGELCLTWIMESPALLPVDLGKLKCVKC